MTAKQRKVLRALEKGRTVKQIAKSMKIGETGVYAHIRRLKELGLLNENGKPLQTTPEPSPAIPPPSDSLIDLGADESVSNLVKDAIGVIEQRQGAITARQEEITRGIAEFEQEEKALIAEQEGLAERRVKLEGV